jgi:hypothetical protein
MILAELRRTVVVVDLSREINEFATFPSARVEDMAYEFPKKLLGEVRFKTPASEL